MTKKFSKMTMHSEKKPETEDINDEVVEWILISRKIGIAVTPREVIVKAWSLNEELKKRSMNAHQKWCYWLLVRNHPTFRECTHVGQELSENYREKMFKLIKLNEAYREQNYLEMSQIANMDETLIFLNMARSKAIAKISLKTVNIKNSWSR